MLKYVLSFLVLTLLVSCKTEPTNEAPKKEEAAADKINPPSTEETYTMMTQEQAQFLYVNADKVDVLFNDVSVSLSQVTQNDVRGQVSFLSPGAVPKNLACSETATIIFQSKGEIIGDGRMYLRGKCRYIVFYEDNKPAYGAYMTDQGMKFYTQVLSAGTSTVKE